MRIGVIRPRAGEQSVGESPVANRHHQTVAAENGHTVFEAYRDVGMKPSETYRDGLMLMLNQAIVHGAFDAVAVTDYSRLSQDPPQLSRLLSALAAVGVKVISLTPA